MNIESVYFFNSLVALKAAKENLAIKGYLFFYDGVPLENAPSNCINVPIGSFYDYFLQTTYPQISQLNFDDVKFSDDIKSQITQNITQTIVAIKNQKIEIVNTLLQAKIDEKNISVMIFSFLKHLVEGSEDEAFTKITTKLQEILNYLQTNSYKPNEQILDLITKLSNSKTDMKSIYLNFILKQLKNKTKLSENKINYLQEIIIHKDMADIFNNFHYVKNIYPPNEFKKYISEFGGLIFSDDFFNLEIIEQKERVYKFFYCTNYVYTFGENFKEIYKVLYPIYAQAIKKEQDELVMFLYYPLQFSWNGVAQTQEEHKQFNDEVELKLESFIKKKLISKYNLEPNTREIRPNQKKIKVVFLIHRVLNQSVSRVMTSLLEAIKKDSQKKYEFSIYDLNFMELMGSDEKEVQKLKKLGFKYVDLHTKFCDSRYAFYSIVDKCLKIRKELIDEKIDILIGYHNRPEYNFLFTTKTAPKQIYWSHGNFEYDLDEIDQRISHITNKSDYQYEYFPIKTLDRFLRDDSTQALTKIKELKELYKSSSIIFGSIGRLIKMDNSDYLNTIATILKKYPDSIYLACGDGDILNIKKELSKLGVDDRVHFPGIINAHIYGEIIDIYLNTFPESGGESITEFKAKGENKFVISFTNSVERYIEDTADIINYISLDIKEIDKTQMIDKRVKITSDKPQTKKDADFIIYLLLKHENTLYIEPPNLNYSLQAYIQKSVPKDKILCSSANIAKNMIDSDIYIIFYISEIGYLATKYKKVIYGASPLEYPDGKIGDDWKNAFNNQQHMGMMKQLLSKEKHYAKAKKDAFGIFSLFHTKAGLSASEQKEYWDYEKNGLNKAKILFDLAIKYENFRKLYQEISFINHQTSSEVNIYDFTKILNKDISDTIS